MSMFGKEGGGILSYFGFGGKEKPPKKEHDDEEEKIEDRRKPHQRSDSMTPTHDLVTDLKKSITAPTEFWDDYGDMRGSSDNPKIGKHGDYTKTDDIPDPSGETPESLLMKKEAGEFDQDYGLTGIREGESEPVTNKRKKRSGPIREVIITKRESEAPETPLFESIPSISRRVGVESTGERTNLVGDEKDLRKGRSMEDEDAREKEDMPAVEMGDTEMNHSIAMQKSPNAENYVRHHGLKDEYSRKGWHKNAEKPHKGKRGSGKPDAYKEKRKAGTRATILPHTEEGQQMQRLKSLEVVSVTEELPKPRTKKKVSQKVDESHDWAEKDVQQPVDYGPEDVVEEQHVDREHMDDLERHDHLETEDVKQIGVRKDAFVQGHWPGETRARREGVKVSKKFLNARKRREKERLEKYPDRVSLAQKIREDEKYEQVKQKWQSESVAEKMSDLLDAGEKREERQERDRIFIEKLRQEGLAGITYEDIFLEERESSDSNSQKNILLNCQNPEVLALKNDQGKTVGEIFKEYFVVIDDFLFNHGAEIADATRYQSDKKIKSNAEMLRQLVRSLFDAQYALYWPEVRLKEKGASPQLAVSFLSRNSYIACDKLLPMPTLYKEKKIPRYMKAEVANRERLRPLVQEFIKQIRDIVKQLPQTRPYTGY